MIAAIAATLLVVIIGLTIAYSWLSHHDPEAISSYDAWFPTGTESLIWLGLALTGFFFAAIIAVRLGRRIAIPLESVAASARKVAEGDLSARAVAGDRSLSEPTGLVDDFNTMAERLESISRSIIEWHAQIAHELRTPLAILQGRLQGLADGVFTPEESLFRSLLKQTESLTRIVEDLRILSLADSGHLAIQRSTTDLSYDIAETCRLVEPRLTAAGFTLNLFLSTGNSNVDASRIRQALLALIENAERHANPGVLAIHLDYSQDRAMIRVSDDGPGMPADFIELAFEPFHQNRTVVEQRHGGGSGLGLSVVRAIARSLGGDVRYEHVNKRSTFIIDIPRCLDTF